MKFSTILTKNRQMEICSARSTGGTIGNSTGWRSKPFHVIDNGIKGLTLSGDTQWSFPAGRYHISYGGCGSRNGWLCMCWYDLGRGTYMYEGRSCNNYNNPTGGTGDSQQVCAGFEIHISDTNIYDLRQYNESTSGDGYTNFGHLWTNSTLSDETAGNGFMVIIRYDNYSRRS